MLVCPLRIHLLFDNGEETDTQDKAESRAAVHVLPQHVVHNWGSRTLKVNNPVVSFIILNVKSAFWSFSTSCGQKTHLYESSDIFKQNWTH